MTPFRKPFDGDHLFPFHIIHKNTKLPQNELPDHLHDFYELVYVYEGKGTFFIDKNLYEKKPGDLFIIPGNTVHRSIPEETFPIVSTALFFAPALAVMDNYDESYSLLNCFDLARKHKIHKIELSDSHQIMIEKDIQSIYRESVNQQEGFRSAIRLKLGCLLLHINRYLSEHFIKMPLENRMGPTWIKKVISEIDAHPERQQSLTEFSKSSLVSQAHFSRVFKQYTGMNLTEYVSAKRISLAKELLKGTDESVASVAEKCGFASIPHFHRTFKLLTKSTPSAYRGTAK